MCTMCSREIFTKKCQQQQIFDSDLKGAWHYNHVTFTPIAKTFMLYCRLIYMLSILGVRLTIKVKVGIPESFKVGWYPPKKTGPSHLKALQTGNGLVIRPTKTQCCGFLGTLLASIGVPLLLNALTGKGTQVDSTGSPSNTVSVYVPDTTNGHGMYNPYPYMSPPFFGT